MSTTNAIVTTSDVASSRRLAAFPSPTSSLCLLVSDLISLSIVYWLVVWSKSVLSHDLDMRFYLKAFPSVLLFLGAFSFQDLYPALLCHPADEMRRVFHSITAVVLVFVSATFVLKSGAEYSRYIFLVAWAAATPAVLIGRTVTRTLFSHKEWWPVRAVMLGSGPAIERVVKSLQTPQQGISISCVLLETPSAFWDDSLPPVVGHLSSAPFVFDRKWARYAIVAMPDRSPAEIRQVVLDHCKNFRHILIVTDVPGVCTLGISPREIGGHVGLEIPQRLSFLTPRVVKRCLDMLVSSLLLAMLSPILLIVALAIKLSSEGPILFGQLRYGRDGKSFRALKFRTMMMDADRVLKAHLQLYPEQKLEWQRDHKLKKDPRITRVGRWLRRYSLDELPQLWNILVGHMSLVGPRPIVHAEISRYATSYDLYTRVPPGLTGLWQVSGRSNTTYRERVALDEYYIRNWSIWMDIYILARTFRAVLQAEGAY